MNTLDYNRGFLDGECSISPTLDKALEALESVQWVDCKDRLPEEVDDFNSADAWVECRTKNGAVLLSLCRYDHKSKKWFDGFNSGEENRITHWMPLPDTAKITEAINEIKKLKG